MVTPEDDVDAVELIRPWASRLVVVVPLVLDVPVVLPCASRKVVLSEFDCEAVPVVLPWASLNVVLVPDVLVVVEDLPFSSLSVAFLPTRVEAGSAKARMGNRRTRISFMDGLDVIGLEIFTPPKAASSLLDSLLLLLLDNDLPPMVPVLPHLIVHSDTALVTEVRKNL